MRHLRKLEVIFTRKFTTVVLVSLIFITLVLMSTGCSPAFSVVTPYSIRTASDLASYRAPLDWNDSIFIFQSGAENPLILPRRGIVTTNFAGGVDEIAAAVIQPDGKIVVAGTASNFGGVGGLFGLARYNSDGSFDTTFGTGGKVTTILDPSGSVQGIIALALQPDGKIVAAGMVSTMQFVFNKNNFGLARYNTDGSLDATFGTGGIVITDVVANQSDIAMALALQTDGKIVAAGFTGSPVTPTVRADSVLVRYNSNGSLDTTFGTGGKVITDLLNDSDFISSLIIQPDGKLLTGGWTYNRSNSSYDFALARFDSNGNFDNSFGSGGKVFADLSNSVPNDPGDDILMSMVLQPDGKILAAGTGEPSRNGTLTDFVIARFNSNGSLDTTFGTGGKVSTDFYGTLDWASSIALQPDGRFVVAGASNGILESFFTTYVQVTSVNTNLLVASNFAVARYNPNGSLDSSFGTGGKGTTDIFGSVDAATKVLIRPDGNILALGFTQTAPYMPFVSISTTTDFASVLYLGKVLQRRKLNDFDGDLKAEFAVFRPSNGTWYLLNSFSNSFRAVQFGVATDKPVAGDYDGDGFADIAVYRSGIWYILQSSDNAFRAVQFGVSEDKPVPDDYDGDGKTDIAVYRPSVGTWYVLRPNLSFTSVQFGVSSDIPVNGDYDGDGRADISVYRPSNGVWYRLNSSNGAFNAFQFGIAEDKPTVGDYDADGIYDFAVFRPSNGVWYLFKSREGFSATQFGLSSDVPIPADYDGDQRTDIAVFRPSNGIWYFLRSSDGSFFSIQFGLNGDVPIPSASVP